MGRLRLFYNRYALLNAVTVPAEAHDQGQNSVKEVQLNVTLSFLLFAKWLERKVVNK